MTRFPLYRQMDQMDCGPSCLRMIARYPGRVLSAESPREKCHITREGVSFGGIADTAEAIGMNTLAVSVDYETLRDEGAATVYCPPAPTPFRGAPRR